MSFPGCCCWIVAWCTLSVKFRQIFFVVGVKMRQKRFMLPSLQGRSVCTVHLGSQIWASLLLLWVYKELFDLRPPTSPHLPPPLPHPILYLSLLGVLTQISVPDNSIDVYTWRTHIPHTHTHHQLFDIENLHVFPRLHFESDLSCCCFLDDLCGVVPFQ